MIRKMKKTISLLIVIGLTAVTNSAFSQTIRGGPTCAEWIKERSPRDTAWLVGYLSGIAVAKDSDFIRGIDNSSLYFWMDRYCESNPLHNVSLGGALLAKELIKQKGQ